MDTSLSLPAAAARRPVTPLARITAASLVGMSAIFTYMQAGVMGHVEPALLVPTALFLGAAGAIATGRRWAPALGAALCALIFLGVFAPAMSIIVAEIVNPGMPMGPSLLAIFALVVVGAASGTWATVQGYRRPAEERRAPRWVYLALAALAGLVAGASALHGVAPAAGGPGVSAEVLAALPPVTTSAMSFEQQEIRVRAGELVALRLENADQVPHSFDVDELGVHVLMPVGEEPGLALFQAAAPGTYTFYCAPHYDKASGQGMHGTLIVE